MISSGASTPPEVPEPKATAQITPFTASSSRPEAGGIVALQHLRDIVVTDTERAGVDEPADADHDTAQCRPPHPVDRQFREQILAPVDELRQQPRQQSREQTDKIQHISATGTRSMPPWNGNSGRGMCSQARSAAAVMAATATGTKLRGDHSNSSNSTASMIAAIGVPNTAVMPAAAPATSSVLRSAR